jgi:integrase
MAATFSGALKMFRRRIDPLPPEPEQFTAPPSALEREAGNTNRDGGEVRLPDSKNGEARTLPLDDELAALIEESWRDREYQTASGSALSAFVFHRRGRPVNRTTFGKQWRKACAKAGLPGRLFHDLRRTAARNMVRGGAPQSVAMRVGGWRTAAMFTRYDISDNRDKLAALNGATAFAEGEAAKRNVAKFPKG